MQAACSCRATSSGAFREGEDRVTKNSEMVLTACTLPIAAPDRTHILQLMYRDGAWLSSEGLGRRPGSGPRRQPVLDPSYAVTAGGRASLGGRPAKCRFSAAGGRKPARQHFERSRSPMAQVATDGPISKDFLLKDSSFSRTPFSRIPIFQGFKSQGFVSLRHLFSRPTPLPSRRGLNLLHTSVALAAPKNIDLKGTVNSLRAARQRPKNNPPVRSGGLIAKPELREFLAQRPMGRWRRARSSISGGDPMVYQEKIVPPGPLPVPGIATRLASP